MIKTNFIYQAILFHIAFLLFPLGTYANDDETVPTTTALTRSFHPHSVQTQLKRIRNPQERAEHMESLARSLGDIRDEYGRISRTMTINYEREEELRVMAAETVASAILQAQLDDTSKPRRISGFKMFMYHLPTVSYAFSILTAIMHGDLTFSLVWKGALEAWGSTKVNKWIWDIKDGDVTTLPQIAKILFSKLMGHMVLTPTALANLEPFLVTAQDLGFDIPDDELPGFHSDGGSGKFFRICAGLLSKKAPEKALPGADNP